MICVIHHLFPLLTLDGQVLKDSLDETIKEDSCVKDCEGHMPLERLTCYEL